MIPQLYKESGTMIVGTIKLLCCPVQSSTYWIFQGAVGNSSRNRSHRNSASLGILPSCTQSNSNSKSNSNSNRSSNNSHNEATFKLGSGQLAL